MVAEYHRLASCRLLLLTSWTSIQRSRPNRHVIIISLTDHDTFLLLLLLLNVRGLKSNKNRSSTHPIGNQKIFCIFNYFLTNLQDIAYSLELLRDRDQHFQDDILKILIFKHLRNSRSQRKVQVTTIIEFDVCHRMAQLKILHSMNLI